MKFTKKFMCLATLFVLVFAVASCGGGSDDEKETKETFTRNTYTAVSPSNWNELTYQDNNDTQIMGYISGSFFEYDYKFDAQGNIIDGQFDVKYSAATKLEDVSADYDGEEAGWGIPEGATGRAFKVTLRNDLKWDDGTPIHAEDFIYTMQQQLAPEFQNYRADTYYNNSVALHMAKEYVKQGQSGWFTARDAYGQLPEDTATLDSLVFTTAGYAYEAGKTLNSYFGSWLWDGYESYASKGTNWLLNALYGVAIHADELEGKTYAEIAASTELTGYLEECYGFWVEVVEEKADFFVCNYTFPEVDWEKVGYFSTAENELVFILDKPLELLDDQGQLTYHCGYDFGSMPLVKKDLYESCKIAPSQSTSLWTSKYNTSVATTASWGPYKLTEFQSGKYYKVERNPYWYGYNMAENEGWYQTEVVECETIEEWNTAFIKFKAGEIDGIGIDPSVAAQYKNSQRAYFTATDYVGSMQLQSNNEALAARETAGVDKQILTNVNFRKAVSVGLDREDYASKTTTACLAGYGIFNSMHYYDVANGGVYRNSEVAKQVIVDVYAVDVKKYANIDDAIASMGPNMTKAKELVETAYQEELAKGTISATDRVVLTYGSSVENESVLRHYNYLNNYFQELVKGTSLEGRCELDFDATFGSNWANAFRDGEYDICEGGWSGAAWNPGYFLLAYLSPDYMYSTAWDTSSAMMTFTFQGAEHTMTLMEWYDCLNANSGAKFDWSSAALTEEERLPLIAALEKEVLSVYYTVPCYNEFSASLLSYKIEYISYNYNTFMSYGGIKYTTFNYSDQEWAEYVKSQGGELDYTK